MKIGKDVTQLIGKTPLVRLNSIDKDLLGKLEQFNPMSSIKDRIAFSMIEEAEKEGLLNKEDGTTVVEPTSGNTGIGLAFVCASKGYDLVLTMPESMSEERRKMLKALGAELVLTPAEEGMKGAVERAEEIIDSRNIGSAFMPQQFKNPANPKVHRETTGREIWEDTDGEVDAVVAGVGTGGTITGISEYIKEEKGKEDFTAVAVEPAGSPVLSGGEAGPHGIQGIGAGFIPEILETEFIDEVVQIEEEDAKKMSRRLARKEGILAGVSSGAAVSAAEEYKSNNEDEIVVVIIPDTGERYLSTDLFNM